jgi:pimeloyl-ACP methyl ester carboxylesterase
VKFSPKKLSALFGPLPVSRDRALSLSERMAAMTSLTSSLEYLTRRKDTKPGGLNDWRIARDVHINSAPPTRKLLDLVAEEKTTLALHGARVAVSAAMLAPGNSRWRGLANIFLGVSNAALYPRHRYGTDGSDQVATMVQTATGLARATNSPEVKDALMWYVALQSNLSYVVSGWVKLLGESWRNGSALGGVMRTRTYGHEGLWKLIQKYPKPAKHLAHSVLALECLFPVVYLKRGVLAKPVIAAAAGFHVANGFLMGLGRFVSSFISMHPMVAYTSTPKDHPVVAGRDDRALRAVLFVAAAAVAGAVTVAGVRRSRAAEAWPGSKTATTRHGNELSYTIRLGEDESKPVLVFVTGMISTVEHFGWILDKLVDETDHDLLTYSRAGYAASKYRGDKDFTVQESVDDLVDLVEETVPEDRDVVFVGHSLGAEFARRAATEMPGRVRGIVYLDSSHPAELQRSRQQGESAERIKSGMSMFVSSLKSGLGALVARPDWVDKLPISYRERVFAQYADSRMWTAGMREWDATEKDFRAFEDVGLPEIDSHALVVSAQRTVDRDPEQLLMHKEIADAHRGSGRKVETVVMEGADHDSLLTNARLSNEVGRRIMEFVDEISPDRAHGSLEAKS